MPRNGAEDLPGVDKVRIQECGIMLIFYHPPPSTRTMTATTPHTRSPAPALHPLFLADIREPPALDRSQTILVITDLLLHPCKRPADPLHIRTGYMRRGGDSEPNQ